MKYTELDAGAELIDGTDLGGRIERGRGGRHEFGWETRWRRPAWAGARGTGGSVRRPQPNIIAYLSVLNFDFIGFDSNSNAPHGDTASI
jgi:hypothetical protein